MYPSTCVRIITFAVVLASGVASARTASAQTRQGPPVQRASTRATPGQFEVTREILQRVGDFYLDSLVRVYGEVRDTALVGDVAAIIERLKHANGLEDRDLVWKVVQNDKVNAITLAGGRMIVFEGLLTFARKAVANSPTSDRPERDRYLALVAAVVGHEIGHVVLGHADSAVARAIRASMQRRGAGFALREAAPSARIDSVLQQLRDTTLMNEGRRDRAAESAADRFGALSILRAGWRIQDAMDLFRLFGTESSSGRAPVGVAREIGALTWLREHPRSAAREADLEILRAELKRHQARLDDALVLIDNGVMLPTAIAMLDTVLSDFPTLPAARHARAAALQQEWLATRTATQLGVQAITATYSANFISGIRSGASSAQLLEQSRQAYHTALRYGNHAYSLANLAVLDAHGGDKAAARRRADSALALAPTDTAVRINAGVARYLVGDFAVARDLFLPVARDVPQAAFNLGRTLMQLGDSAGGVRSLVQYLEAQVPPGWAAESKRLLRLVPNTTIPEPAKGLSGAVPDVAGIRLGGSPTSAITTLGRPTSERADGSNRVLIYEDRELVVVLSPRDRIKGIVLLGAAAGDIDGVRVGGAVNSAALRWGRPDQEHGGRQVFQREGYWILLHEAGGVIMRIQLALN
jgi:predicted Zn-dependent protease